MAWTPLLVATCLLLSLQGAVSAPSQANHCCYPVQFEGKIDTSAGQALAGTGAIGMMNTGTVHADFTNQRVAVIEKIIAEEYITDITVIEDLNAHTMHVISPSAETCIKLPLPDSDIFSKSACISKNFTLIGTQKLGMSDDSLDINIYERSVTSPAPLLMKIYATKSNCLPVFESFMVKYSSAKLVQGQVYSDITLGIKDTSVFTLPAYCQKSLSFKTNDKVIKDAISRHHARRTMWS